MVSKVEAYTDHQALTYLQQLKASKPLRGRTARWLFFLAVFPDLTITFLPVMSNRVADALTGIPCDSPESSTSASSTVTHNSAPELVATLVQVANSASSPTRTRERSVNYRELAGLRGRASQRRQTTPPSRSAATPLHAGALSVRTGPPTGEPQQTDVQVAGSRRGNQSRPTSPSLSLDWLVAYPRCPVFGSPHEAAAPRQGEPVQVDFQQ